MSSCPVHFLDGRTPRWQPALLSREGDDFVVRGAFGERRARRGEVEIADALAGAPRFVYFPDGSSCEVPPDALAEFSSWLAAERIAGSALSRLEGRWPYALLALLFSVAIIAAAYVWLLPAFAGWAAPRVPASVVQALSDQVLEALDGRVLAPSQLSQPERDAIGAEVAALSRGGLPLPAHRLHFRSAAGAPNAFALPSGDIVIFDGLVRLADGPAGVAAVVAHELGHVELRHGLRQLIQSSVVSFVVGIYFGDVSTAVSGLAALLLESRYSRDFERAADDYAVRLLHAAGADPAALATMLARLETAHGGAAAGWLASHPDTRARIAAIEAARR